MYKYETHLHTSLVSGCGRYGVRENLEFYKNLGYDGVFITEHFLDGNIAIDKNLDYKTKINFLFSSYEKALEIGKELGIKVFFGTELFKKGTDFLVYGLDKEWYLNHEEIMNMSLIEELKYYQNNGALVVHAHPFRNRNYVESIRLVPDTVKYVEVINACNAKFENDMAKLYVKKYKLQEFAGSDNHVAFNLKTLAGIKTKKPINDIKDFINIVKNKEYKIFQIKNKT